MPKLATDLARVMELLARAYEVVRHDVGCPSIGGNGDTDCKCDAVPFLRDLESALQSASGGDSASLEQRARSLLPDGWTHDCQGKQDYDADLLALSCRYYPANYQRNGKAAVSAAVVWGEGDERLFHATLEAETESQVKAMAESWAAEKIVAIRAALANQQGVAVGAYPTGSDREVLQYLMQQFDVETWQCPSCGHAEDTASMDSADYLRKYLAEHPAEQQGVGDQ